MKRLVTFVLIVLAFPTAHLRALVEDLQDSNTTVRASEPIEAERSGEATQSEPNVTVFAAKGCDPSHLALLLAAVYESSDVIVEALPVMKCVAVRADEKTTICIGELLRSIERAAQNDGKPQIRIIPITPDHRHRVPLDLIAQRKPQIKIIPITPVRPGELPLRSGNFRPVETCRTKR